MMINRKLFFLIGLALCCNLQNVQSVRKETLTPRMETSSFSSEQKRIAEDIVVNINQARGKTVDEIKKLSSRVANLEMILNTDLNSLSTTVANNMKRHSQTLLHHFSAIFKLLSAELPKQKHYLHLMNKNLLEKLKILDDRSLQSISFQHAAEDKEKDMRSWLGDLVGRLFAELGKIEKNTDLGNTDSNSVGKQVKEMSVMLQEMVDAVGVMDQRLPAIDSNGDGIMRSMQGNFEALNQKMEGIGQIEVNVQKLAQRVERALERMSDNSYPRNDNHIPEFGNVPPAFGGDTKINIEEYDM